jgi:hypothetical protein
MTDHADIDAALATLHAHLAAKLDRRAAKYASRLLDALILPARPQLGTIGHALGRLIEVGCLPVDAAERDEVMRREQGREFAGLLDRLRLVPPSSDG